MAGGTNFQLGTIKLLHKRIDTHASSSQTEEANVKRKMEL